MSTASAEGKDVKDRFGVVCLTICAVGFPAVPRTVLEVEAIITRRSTNNSKS